MVQSRRRAGTVLVALMLASVLLLTLAPVSRGQTPEGRSASSEQGATPDHSRLLRKAEQEGSVRVIVRLRTDFVPEGRLGRPEAADQRDEIRGARAGLQEDLGGTGYQIAREFKTVPFVALEASSRALEAIQRSPLATDVVEDRLSEPYQDEPASSDLDSTNLAESSPLIQAPTMWANGFTGSGQTVAVLDTGVDSSHPFLGGRVTEEACYSNTSNCPNGQATQTGPGSGVNCTYAASGCSHGTHVAGIAAGQGSSFSGVAKGADVMAVQVFSRFTGSTYCGSGEDPCTLSYTSDQMQGLERVYALSATRNFSSVNMSLGGQRFFSNCDSDTRKPIIDNLRSAGIATVIASGNKGFTDSMGAPACISSAVSVGSTTESDAVSSFSNSASFLSLLAPGQSINSSVPGGGFAVSNGTSMATPQVAGAWALLKQQTPSGSVASLLSSLQDTGPPVTDTRAAGGVTKPRIKIADAADSLIPRPTNNDFANAQTLVGADATATGTNVDATKESGEPDHAGEVGGKSVWYSWTPQEGGATTIDAQGSDFDTLLAVYSGDAVNSLSAVASNNDNGGAQSTVSFTATAGNTYRIAVDGSNAESGDTNLRLVSDDTTAPGAPLITGPAEGSYDKDGSFALSGTAEAGSTVELFEGTTSKGTDTADAASGQWTIELVGVPEGSHSYTAKATDAAGNASARSEVRMLIVDTAAPLVSRVVPQENATRVAPGANVNAYFSETMTAGSVNTTAVRLFKKGTAAPISAMVGYDASTNKAVLNPTANLKRGAKYIAVVGTGAEDLAGNGLDQNPALTGDQPKQWFFTVRS
jgi:subtilisin family serine protease